MIEYFYNTKIRSPISDTIIDNLENYQWWTGRRGGQWEPTIFDQTLIELDPFLKKFHRNLNGKLNLFKFPPNTFYRWHCDGENAFNFNLVLKSPDRSFVVFEKITQDLSISHIHLKEIVELKYQPFVWYVFNAQIPHSICNLGNETRYILTYAIKKDQNISYKDFLSMAGGTGFEPVDA